MAGTHPVGGRDPFDDDADDHDLIDPDSAGLDDYDDPLHDTTPNLPRQEAPTGSMRPREQRQDDEARSYLTSSIPGEDRRAPTNTLDETVWATLSRDLLAVWEKMQQVLYPRHLLDAFVKGGQREPVAGTESESLSGNNALRGIVNRLPDADAVLQGNMSPGLRDWDLWGPLLFCLLLSFLLSLRAQDKQRSGVFSGVFAIVWIGEAVVTLQIKLLGGNISFFQSVCIIGYTLFPLVIAALLSALHLIWIARIPVYLALIAWSLAAGVSILGGSEVIKNRVGLAIYPLFVFYVGLGCLCFVS